ncbi:MAG: NAD(P)-dependent alcohol dehydrogenase [Synechococcales bacterium]|nr:NAD(P)-dependent alcohol dehydrogenase [Synechococcales bacterium]
MKAVIIHRYGSADVLQYREDAPIPAIAPDQLLVRVRAVSVNPVDWKVRQGMFQWLPIASLPRVLGSDFAGDVVEVGSQVRAYQVGDAVYGSLNPITGGGYAEFVAAPEGAIARKPAIANYEEAAAIPTAGLTALQALRDYGELKSGQQVLINGASGGVGTFAVQIAKSLGATVTAVCSDRNFDLVRRLGGDRTLDYSLRDFTKESARYDVIFDAAGKRTFSDCRSALTSEGIYVSTLPNPDVIFWSGVTALLPGQKAKIILVQVKTSDLVALNSLMDEGKVRVIIDRTYPLSAIQQAHRDSETEHTAGKRVLTV